MQSPDLRVMVVDDSVFFRQLLSVLLEEIDGIEVVGTAPNGDIALKKAKTLHPDLITVDVEMPGMDGLELLQHLQTELPETFVVMISSVTKKGAKCTIQALEKGALDFIEKPCQDDPEENERDLSRQLKRIMAIVVNKKLMTSTAASRAKIKPAITTLHQPDQFQCNKIKLIVVGISTGGPAALPVLFESLSTDINVPILIVQHLPPLFVDELVESLNRKVKFDVVVGKSYQELLPNTIYIAPGNTQMKLAKPPNANAPIVMLTDDEPENFCKPSVDYMFRSVGEFFGNNILALIMTGMGRDGVLGLEELKKHHATIYAQDEESSVVYGMAMEAVKADVVDEIIPLSLMAKAIEERVHSDNPVGGR
ncbi:MAG: chemotaxis response regulator protein-glutamate methylesterase [Gammaproteobacteria bacterium]|nr:MAG: chemotaxis response regulator protein-glutamate methylesterase [Gammaproteobacteria bacterium]